MNWAPVTMQWPEQATQWMGGLSAAKDLATGEPRTLEGFEPLPAGFTLEKPGPNQIWKDGEWVDDIDAVLAALYDNKQQAIGVAYSRYVAGGFSSDALGELHRYGSTIDDQVDLNGQVLLGMDDIYPCLLYTSDAADE